MEDSARASESDGVPAGGVVDGDAITGSGFLPQN